MGIINSILNAFYGFYDAALLQIVSQGPYISLTAFSAVVAGLFSLSYWYFVDQEKMENLKDQIQEKKEERKDLQEEGREEEMSDLVSEMMSLQQKLMIESFKPTIGMMVLLATFFPWLGSTYAPSIGLDSSGPNSFEGTLEYGEKQTNINVQNTTKGIKINGQPVDEGDVIKISDIKWQVAGFGEKTGGFLSSGEGTRLKLNFYAVSLPFSIPFIGNALNWLGFYILINMPVTFAIRRAMGLS